MDKDLNKKLLLSVLQPVINSSLEGFIGELPEQKPVEYIEMTVICTNKDGKIITNIHKNG